MSPRKQSSATPRARPGARRASRSGAATKPAATPRGATGPRRRRGRGTGNSPAETEREFLRALDEALAQVNPVATPGAAAPPRDSPHQGLIPLSATTTGGRVTGAIEVTPRAPTRPPVPEASLPPVLVAPTAPPPRPDRAPATPPPRPRPAAAPPPLPWPAAAAPPPARPASDDREPRPPTAPGVVDLDAILGGYAEVSDRTAPDRRGGEPRRRGRSRRLGLVALALVAVALGVSGAVWEHQRSRALDRPLSASALRAALAAPDLVRRLAITSIPAGARVTCDDEEQPGRTPLVARLFRSDRPVTVRVTLPGYLPFTRTVPPTDAARDHLVAALVPAPGTVQLRGTPAGATITLDGRPAGTLPATLTGIDTTAPHLLELTAPGHRSAQHRLAPTDQWQPLEGGRALSLVVSLAALRRGTPAVAAAIPATARAAALPDDATPAAGSPAGPTPTAVPGATPRPAAPPRPGSPAATPANDAAPPAGIPAAPARRDCTPGDGTSCPRPVTPPKLPGIKRPTWVAR